MLLLDLLLLALIGYCLQTIVCIAIRVFARVLNLALLALVMITAVSYFIL